MDRWKTGRRLPPLTPRLRLVASLVRPGGVVADIGTDHARLPVWLVLSGRSRAAIAGDIRPGPLEAARRTVEAYAAADRVRLVLSDGLARVPAADDVVLAGMGGEQMIAILDGCLFVRSPAVRLVLQPMTAAEELRRYLCRAGFSIRREAVAREGRRLYVAMAAEYTGRSFEPDELYSHAGTLRGPDSPAVRDYLNWEAAVLSRRAAGLRASVRRKAEAEPLERRAAGLRRLAGEKD